MPDKTGVPIPPCRSLLGRALMMMTGWLARCVWRIEVTGSGNAPESGAFVLCSNHQSWFDSLMVGIWLDPGPRRRIACFAKRELFEHFATRQIMRWACAIPIDRGGRIAGAVHAGKQVLTDGRPLFLHPEGTRTRTGRMGPFMNGAAHLALVTQSPMVPVRIEGTFEICPPTRSIPRLFDWRGGRRLRIHVSFGEPISPGGETTPQRVRDMTEQLRRAIDALGDGPSQPGHFEEMPAATQATDAIDAVFVVSGGGRGITARCVIEMARCFQCGFVLLGRTSVSEQEPQWAAGCETESDLTQRLFATEGASLRPADARQRCRAILARREIRNTLESIRSAGGRAQYLQADVADREQLSRVLGSTDLQSVTGILHGAGVISDKRIQDKTSADFDQVYDAKVTGLQNLLSALRPERLQHVILFASAAGFFGNEGQTDYALANEILNRFGYSIQSTWPHIQVLCFNWGPWDGGMVTPELRSHFLSRGIVPIPVDAGTQILNCALSESTSGSFVVGAGMSRVARTTSGPEKVHRLTRTLSLDANPFLKDHVVGGAAVLPITFAIGWLADACEMVYPDLTVHSVRDYRALKGVVFNADLATEYAVELRDIESRPDEVVIAANVTSESSTRQIRPHYRATITMTRSVPAPPRIPFVVPAAENGSPGNTLYDDGTLFHGGPFRGIQRVLSRSERHMTALCVSPRVTDVYQGQFQFESYNPFAGDITHQVVLVWAREYHGAAALPAGGWEARQYRKIPFGRAFYVHMDVVKETAHSVAVELTTHDEEGYLFNTYSRSELTLNRDLSPLFLQNTIQ